MSRYQPHIRGPIPEQMTVQDELLTLSESAELANVHVNTIRNWIQSGKLAAARYRNSYVISKVVLAMAVAESRIEALEDSAKAAVEQDLLTPADVSTLLGVSKQRVNQLIAAGSLKTVDVGKHWRRIRREEYERFKVQRESAEIPRRRGPASLLTLESVAETLSVSTYTVKNLIDDGELSGVRVSRNVLRVEPGSVKRFLARKTVSARKHRNAISSLGIAEAEDGKVFVSKVKIKTNLCRTCMQKYPSRGYGEHIQDAEHVRAIGLRSGISRV